MPRTQPCCTPRDLDGDRLDSYPERGQRFVDGGFGGRASTLRSDQDLGVGAGGKHERGEAVLPQGGHGGRMMDVTGVEKAHEDAGIQND